MRYVIDAGVVVKWFIPEVDSDIAHQLLERYLQGVDGPVVPDLLIAECGNVFWRRCRQGDITLDEATESLADLLTLQVGNLPQQRDGYDILVPYARSSYMVEAYS